ncbi:MAG: hypothetical protein ABI183_01030, partial [Polyangiaceae bacterium]
LKILSGLPKSNTPFSDKSSPEEIFQRFGLSKKAFKRAVGRLLQNKRIAIDENRFVVLAKKK